MPSQQNSLLLVLPLPLYIVNGQFFLDTQACNGLRLWLDNFEHVTLCAPASKVSDPPPMTSAIKQLLPSRNLRIQPLPTAWTPTRFLARFPTTARLLNGLIGEATHLQFAIGGFWGDWGAVAAILASRKGRKAAIWTDRVESKVIAFQAEQRTGLRRLYWRLNAGLAWQLERYVIRRSAIGLFHGMDTYHTYSLFSANPHLVHDIHLGPESRISTDELHEKIGRTADQPLKIVYGGRVHPDKGVKDWIEALLLLHEKGVSFGATWFGDGPELAMARDLVSRYGLDAAVRFPGPAADHDELMRAFRQADLLAFCHKTPESPRCLIEALIAGSPIVGYTSFYASDLIRDHGGGRLTAANPAALAAELVKLAERRDVLANLIAAAAQDGHPLIDEVVFRHRSDLIKSLDEQQGA